jgi:protein TonB
MKKLLFFLVALMVASVSVAQNQENPEKRVFDVVEKMPEFPGGSAGLMKWLSDNVKYPAKAEEGGIQGRVVCTFVIERDGSVTDVRVARSIEPLLDNEAVRVLSKMPKWNPGTQNGKPVRVKYTVPVTFRLAGDTPKKKK